MILELILWYISFMHCILHSIKGVMNQPVHSPLFKCCLKINNVEGQFVTTNPKQKFSSTKQY